MNLTRRLYQADSGGTSYLPLDSYWGMAGEFATAEVRESITLASAYLTAKEIEELFGKSCLFHPSETAVQNIIQETGSFIEAHREALNEAVFQESLPPSTTEILVASLDGANVLLREAGPKKGRPRQRLGEPDSPAQSSYKNAMVGSFSSYSISDNDPKKLRPVRLESSYIARMPQEKYPDFKQLFEQRLDTIESKLSADVVKLLLNDGHRSIWGYIESQERFDDYEKLIDFYHSSEHLSLAAESIFGKSSQKANQWYDKWYAKLQSDDNAASQLLRSMNYYQKEASLPKNRKDALEKQITFFQRNHQYMNYALFLRRGWPIGSGPVEAACKSIVKTRMGRSGMRWSRKGGQSILSLRAYAKSKQWDAFWKNYLKLKKAA
jgi:hypothetical protein